ncbi:SDR family NAD(P)-dependent oxidoreductase [Bacillus timonensis]|uniref:SDR family NAD(P)-dependent oxidoreductase n=1 Tax=Bacillus timonensis TaxID=1033734 RepID=UPI00028A2773|nr:SDR family oxidoreductase [Bacillus timonensis]
MKAAIVTGSGSGIGRAIAKSLAKNNYFVTVTDINLQNAKEVVQEIISEGGEAIAEYVDISNEETIKNMISSSISKNRNLVLLVNNAGVNFTTTVEDCTPEEFDNCIAINLKGHYLVTKHSIPLLKNNPGSNIINISSTHAFRTQPRYFPYSAAKAGILSMTRSMAIDLRNYLIRVNAICPGLIQTPIMNSSLFEETDPYYQKVIKYHPVGRLGKPEDIANAVLFLSSENASFINGETLVIDGGRSCITYELD